MKQHARTGPAHRLSQPQQRSIVRDEVQGEASSSICVIIIIEKQ